ncbi:hypothetical protein [Deinococcus yavapaiensis]|uniref:Lipoprotein n=1 Tax=Deinococcus yavapaiensis KR-236 TaxID=694435 RepID=A0A318SI02_9DEIO|nr:hypothetical protein [Deinococcus yavapaiensis]PYE51002.1 hypothetical protein DES52_11669 [Deinococcus yavapaiensis KR-236]
MNIRVLAAALTLSVLTACGSMDRAVGSAPPALTALGERSTSSSLGNLQISGTAVYDVSGSTCSGPPSGFADFVSYPGLVLSGRLQGCWYTKVESSKTTPSGVYLETGREVFVGSLNGGPVGVFATTYKFESKFSGSTEIFGRCHHPLVAGSGTGGFAGATGRVDFKDIVADPSNIYYVYRGHIKTR